jgi:hypothetical protein
MRRKTASCATPESSTKGGSFISRAIHRFIFHRIDKQAYWNKFIDFRNESFGPPGGLLAARRAPWCKPAPSTHRPTTQ